MNKSKVFASTLFGLILCLPITGFIHGFIACRDCGNGFGGFLGRLFIGLVQSFNTVITMGKPWQTEAGINFIDLRLWVLLTFVLLAMSIYALTTRHKRKKITKEKE